MSVEWKLAMLVDGGAKCLGVTGGAPLWEASLSPGDTIVGVTARAPPQEEEVEDDEDRAADPDPRALYRDAYIFHPADSPNVPQLLGNTQPNEFGRMGQELTMGKQTVKLLDAAGVRWARLPIRLGDAYVIPAGSVWGLGRSKF